jgi:hypothetical protein
MSLDLWFREDVARILVSTHEAMSASLQAAAADHPAKANAYKQGFGDALHVVGIAFGVAVARATDSRPSASNGPLGQVVHEWESEGRWSLMHTGQPGVGPDREEP